MNDILDFINTLRESDKYIQTIFLNGSCYQFHLLLKTFFDNCEPYISKQKDHIITKHNDNFYDITGIVSGEEFTPLSDAELNFVKSWSFYKTKMLQIHKCPFCEEPLLI